MTGGLSGAVSADFQALLDGLPRRIHEIAERRAADAPDKPALIEEGASWSYGELAGVVARTADWLAAQGVRPGDRLMIVNENCRALAALIFAASRLDAWAVIVNARLSPREIDLIRDHSGARRVIFTTAVSGDAAAHAERQGALAVEHPDLGAVAIGPLNEDARPEAVSADGAGQCAAMIYTSGTTGQPKGVMLSHRNLLYVAAMSARVRQLKPDDLVYGVLPISHVFGLSSVFLGTMAAGGCLMCVPRFDPGHAMANLAAGLTVFQGVPAMYAKLLERAESRGQAISAPKLRYISAGGSPLDADLKRRVEAALGLVLNNGYGLTEAAPTISQTVPGKPLADTSTGPVMEGVEAKLVDPVSKDEVGPGEVGELWVRGPGVMLGYYRNPEATREVLLDGGWLNCGDLARIDAAGSLHIVGRSKELIIRSGFNVYPPEVEAVLNSHPQVTQSAVVGCDVPGNEEVVAFVELAPGATVTGEELRAYAAEHLAPYKRPAEVIELASLPAGSTGKILKARLKEMAAAQHGASAPREGQK